MSDPIAATSDLRSVALSEISAIRESFRVACELARNSSDGLEELLTPDSCRAHRGVSVLKVMECSPQLGKTGARAVTHAAGLSFRATFDELTPEMFIRLKLAMSEQSVGN